MTVTIYVYHPKTEELLSVETFEPPIPRLDEGGFRSQHDEICGCNGRFPLTNYPGPGDTMPPGKGGE